MKVLVTGADGFIGSHLVEELLAIGHDVRAFVYYRKMMLSLMLDHLAQLHARAAPPLCILRC
jgi:dTDP-glucose 4,6-dehydratase